MQAGQRGWVRGLYGQKHHLQMCSWCDDVQAMNHTSGLNGGENGSLRNDLDNVKSTHEEKYVVEYCAFECGKHTTCQRRDRAVPGPRRGAPWTRSQPPPVKEKTKDKLQLRSCATEYRSQTPSCMRISSKPYSCWRNRYHHPVLLLVKTGQSWLHPTNGSRGLI